MTYHRQHPPAPPPPPGISSPDRLHVSGEQAITSTPSSLFICRFSPPLPYKRLDSCAAVQVGTQRFRGGVEPVWNLMRGQTYRGTAGTGSSERTCCVGRGASARPRFCVTISRTPLWCVSKDAKHHISGILSRIPKGSLSITKIWLLVFCLYFCYEKRRAYTVFGARFSRGPAPGFLGRSPRVKS